MTDSSPIRIHVNKMENRVTFKTKTAHYLDLLSTLALYENTKKRTTKDKNGEHVAHLEVTEVILVQHNNVNNNYQQDTNKIFVSICSQ